MFLALGDSGLSRAEAVPPGKLLPQALLPASMITIIKPTHPLTACPVLNFQCPPALAGHLASHPLLLILWIKAAMPASPQAQRSWFPRHHFPAHGLRRDAQGAQCLPNTHPDSSHNYCQFSVTSGKVGEGLFFQIIQRMPLSTRRLVLSWTHKTWYSHRCDAGCCPAEPLSHPAGVQVPEFASARLGQARCICPHGGVPVEVLPPLLCPKAP